MNHKHLFLRAAFVTAAATIIFQFPAMAATTPVGVSPSGMPYVIAMGKRPPNATDSSQGDLQPDEQFKRDLQDPSKTTTPADIFIPGSTVPVRQDDSNGDSNSGN